MIEKEVISDLDSVLTRLAEAIAESEEFKEFESARLALSQDPQALQLLQELQAKESAACGFPCDGQVSDEIESLRAKVFSLPAVARSVAAQETLTDVFMQVAAAVESATGFDFAVGCAATRGCC